MSKYKFNFTNIISVYNIWDFGRICTPISYSRFLYPLVLSDSERVFLDMWGVHDVSSEYMQSCSSKMYTSFESDRTTGLYILSSALQPHPESFRNVLNFTVNRSERRNRGIEAYYSVPTPFARNIEVYQVKFCRYKEDFYYKNQDLSIMIKCFDRIDLFKYFINKVCGTSIACDLARLYAYKLTLTNFWVFVNCTSGVIDTGFFYHDITLLTVGAPIIWLLHDIHLPQKWISQSGHVLVVKGGKEQRITGFSLGPSFVFMQLVHSVKATLAMAARLAKTDTSPFTTTHDNSLWSFCDEDEIPHVMSVDCRIILGNALTYSTRIPTNLPLLISTVQNVVHAILLNCQLKAGVLCHIELSEMPIPWKIRIATYGIIDCHILFMSVPSTLAWANKQLADFGFPMHFYQWDASSSYKIPGFTNIRSGTILPICVFTKHSTLQNLSIPLDSFVQDLLRSLPSSSSGAIIDQHFTIEMPHRIKLGAVFYVRWQTTIIKGKL
jgi:hypothetical protein